MPDMYSALPDAPLAPPESPYVFDFSKSKLSPNEILDKYTSFPDDLVCDSMPIAGTETPGFSPIYRNKCFPQGTKQALAEELNTYHKIISNSVEHYSDKPLFASRKYDIDTGKLDDSYTRKTYGEVEQMKRAYGSGLLYLLKNNPFKQSEKYEAHRKIDNHESSYQSYDKDNYSFIFTLYASNREEWVLSDMMTSSFSITNTSLYDTLGEESSKYILELTQSPVIATSKNHLAQLIHLKAAYPEELGALISIICFDSLNVTDNANDREMLHLCRSHNIALHDLNQVIEVGKMFPSEQLPPNPETLYTISFTSGTTGAKSKGVLLDHANVAGTMMFCVLNLPHTTDDRSFSFLPLAHIYERKLVAVTLALGNEIGFPRANGTPLTLVEDLKLYKPTRMANVPRIYTRFESLIKSATVESPSAVRSKLFNHVINTKINRQSQHDGADGRHLLYDTVILSKIRSLLGHDNMRYIIGGSAPIAASTIQFLKASLNVGFVLGYGLTESFAGVCFSRPYEKAPGSCGVAVVSTEMKIREVPEMGYRLDDPDGPRGELLLRGAQIFKGYLKNPEETAKVLDSDGWFSTGDIARFDKITGRVYIVDRLKSFFKLSQGEYISPEKIEANYLSNNPILTQCFSHGDFTQSYLVGVLGITPESLRKFLSDNQLFDEKQLLSLDDNQLLHYANKPEARRCLLAYLNSKATVQGFEKLHNIYVDYEPLSLGNNLLTPTLKIKRPLATKHFREQIDRMYEEGSLVKNSKL